jgi:hypothetical protein
VKREAEVKRERENQGGAQSRKVGRAAGKHRAARRKQKAVCVRAGETECAKVGERPLYANHILRAPFAFFLGRAFKLAITKSVSGCMPINIYAALFAFFLGRAFKLAIAKSASGCMPINIYTAPFAFF